jgi:hypothetical protein
VDTHTVGSIDVLCVTQLAHRWQHKSNQICTIGTSLAAVCDKVLYYKSTLLYTIGPSWAANRVDMHTLAA